MGLSETLEFDVQFSRIPNKTPMDVTINWTDLRLKNEGVFYTDANSY
jgi:hypothetical protein